MTPQEELQALRRLAELEAKAGKVAPSPIDPTEGNSFGQNALIGAGKAFTDLGRGVKQLGLEALDYVSPEQQGLKSLVTGPTSRGARYRKEIDEANRLDAPLMNTGGGLTGNIVGNVAASVPAALIPGAGTIAGGAAIGGALSALNPVGTDESRLGNVGFGALAGGAVPALLRAGKVAKSAPIDPFTEAGQNRIVGSAVNRAVEDPKALATALRSAKASTPDFELTAAQAAPDGGLAALERTARAIDPGGFSAVDQSQRSALVNALRSVAKTPEERAAAVTARGTQAETLYKKAFDETIQDTPWLKGQFTQLMKRPAFVDALKTAQTNAINEGVTWAKGAANKGKIDEREAVKILHYAKMALDDEIGIAKGAAEKSGLVATRDKLLSVLESNKAAPSYKAAREAYASASRPVNQMDIGQELYNRFVPALADSASVPFKSRADALADALRNRDKLARNVSGMNDITFGETMDPAQVRLLEGVVKDSGAKAAAEMAGKGVGSDSVQKMAMSNVIAQAGLPSWVSSVGRVPGGWLKTAGDILYSKNDETLRHLLAQKLRDPKALAAAMEKAGASPSEIQQYLRAAAQSTAMGLPATMNAP